MVAVVQHFSWGPERHILTIQYSIQHPHFSPLQTELPVWISRANKSSAILQKKKKRKLHIERQADKQNCYRERKEKAVILFPSDFFCNFYYPTCHFLFEKPLVLSAGVNPKFRDVGEEVLYLNSRHWRRNFCLRLCFGPHFSLNFKLLLPSRIDYMHLSDGDYKGKHVLAQKRTITTLCCKMKYISQIDWLFVFGEILHKRKGGAFLIQKTGQNVFLHRQWNYFIDISQRVPGFLNGLFKL